MNKKSYVAITKAPEIDYTNDYISLPENYGSDEYYNREDITNIIQTLNNNLTTLDSKTGFTKEIKNRKVVIKINLVTVFNKIGFERNNYPNTVDPRLIDGLVSFLKHYTGDIVIAESSGRSFPTRGSMKVAGIDRIAEKYKIKLMYLEEEAVDRYVLPKARVMKECIVPKIFSEIARGDAFYISVPKMKTNLYTDVTLGFKNGMGCLTYNLRQRDHHFDIDQKLVDMLFLFKPDLVIIDGIVGAEGQSPGAVDPVDSRVIISGNNCVETDRVASRMMGFDPVNIKLIRIATEMEFGDPGVEVIGEEIVIPFKKANPSLMSDEFNDLFPNVCALIGHRLRHSPVISNLNSVDNKLMLDMELSCRGGCLASTRLGFEFLNAEGLNRNFKLTVIIGCGADVNGALYYFDRNGKPYSLSDIALMSPSVYGKKLAVGRKEKKLHSWSNPLID